MTLTFDRTVSRALVHVRAISEIFITDSEQVGEDEFVLATQLPRAHMQWSDRLTDHHDPLVTVEIGRQAAFLVAHRYYGVPTGSPCLLHRVDLTIDDLDAFADDRSAPPEGTIRVRVHDKQHRDGGLAALGFAGDLRLGESTAVTMDGEMAVFRRPDYQLLRAQTRARKDLAADPPPPVGERMAPELLGRRDERNVVIRPSTVDPESGEHRYTLVADESHPGFFDHPHDHVTGSLMLEVYRQSAIASAHRAGLLPAPVAAVTGCSLRFTGLGELDARVECVATVKETGNGRVDADLRLWQLGTQIAEARLELTSLPQRRFPVTAGPSTNGLAT